MDQGGLLELHTANFNNYYVSGKEFPGGLVVRTKITQNVDVESKFHPVVNEPYIIDSDMLDKWGSSAHGYFEVLPDSALTITVHSGTALPATVEVIRGKGLIIATQQTVEWLGADHRFLENMILFGLQKTSWMKVQPVAGIISSDAQSQIELQFSDKALLPGDSRHGKLRIFSNVPNSMVLKVPVDIQVQDAPALAIESFRFRDSTNGDNDGIIESGESGNLVVTFKNVGTRTAYNVSATLGTNVSDVMITTPTANLGDLNPGQISSEISYPVQVSDVSS